MESISVVHFWRPIAQSIKMEVQLTVKRFAFVLLICCGHAPASVDLNGAQYRMTFSDCCSNCLSC